jgi:formate dehydrogenase major subunit
MLGHTRSTVSTEDIEKADLFIVVGGNPCQDNPVLGWQIKRRMRQGTEAIVVNSAEIDMVKYAAAWADTRRGTATHLLNGVMAELIRDGKANDEFISNRTMHFEQVKQDLAKIDLEETAAVTGVAERKIKRIVELLSDPNKRVVAVFNIDSRIDRSSNDLKALATLMMMLGKVGVEGSGLAILSNQSNLTGMALAGFDHQRLPGDAPICESGLSETSRVWRADLKAMFANPGANFEALMQNDKIRAAIVLGENPASDPKYDALLDKLDFLVVCDLFKTESIQKADVFLPLSGYLETDGHMTNWAGMQQRSNPIGEPLNGMNNLEIIHKLSSVLGQEIQSYLFADVVGELDLLRKNLGASIGTTFVTEDGKAHFGLYSSDISPTSAFVPEAVELDARIVDRLRLTEA